MVNSILRKLEVKDSQHMLEWVHDETVLRGLQCETFRRKTLENCIDFIKTSQNDRYNYHMAIVDHRDIYQGTVSFKNIDFDYCDAEFSIVLKTSSPGKGYAKQSILDIMQIAFCDLNLRQVLWNVLVENDCAISLYRKCGYDQLKEVPSRMRKCAPIGKNVLYFFTERESWLIMMNGE